MPIKKERYPPNWDSEIRPRIRARAGEVLASDGKTVLVPPRCEWCGAPDRTWGYHTPDGKRFLTHQEMDDELHATGHDHFSHELKGLEPVALPVKIVMTVAHLDHDETNWAVTDDRLACICMTCHLRYDKRDNWRRRIHNQLARRAAATRQLPLFSAPHPLPADATTLPDHH